MKRCLYIGVAERGTGDEIPPYNPVIDTVVCTETSSVFEQYDKARQRQENIAEEMGWENFYSFMTSEITGKYLADFANEVLQKERKRTNRHPEYEVFCLLSLNGRHEQVCIHGKTFVSYEEAKQAAAELNAVAQKNGFDILYLVQPKSL